MRTKVSIGKTRVVSVTKITSASGSYVFIKNYKSEKCYSLLIMGIVGIVFLYDSNESKSLLISYASFPRVEITLFSITLNRIPMTFNTFFKVNIMVPLMFGDVEKTVFLSP